MNKFGHIGVYVTDLSESKKFYMEVLGCEVIEERITPQMTLCFLDAGGTVIELISKKDALSRPHPGCIDHMAFKVEAIDPLILMLKERNIEILSEPRISGTSRIVFFKGPNNERFEFVERYNG